MEISGGVVDRPAGIVYKVLTVWFKKGCKLVFAFIGEVEQIIPSI